MKTFFNIAYACLILFLASPRVNGTDTPLPPKLPLVTPTNACWIVHTSIASSPSEQEQRAPSSSPVNKTRFDQSKDFIRIRAYQGDTMLSEYWIFKNGQSVAYPTGGTLVITQVDQQSIESELVKGTYPDLSWLSKDNYRGLVRYENRLCHYFSDSEEPAESAVKPPLDSSGNLPNFKEAWIDPQAKRPIAVKLGGALRTYEFLSTPPDVQIGSEMRQRLAEIDENRKAYDNRHAMP